MAERIVVTGMGAVTPLGLGVDALFDGLCADLALAARDTAALLRRPDGPRE